MLRYWNRLIHMDYERLTKRFFICDFNRRRTSGNWNSNVYKVFFSLSKLDIYGNMEQVVLASAKIGLREIERVT